MALQLVFVTAADRVPAEPIDGQRFVVTDETWTAPEGSDVLALRDLIVQALSGRDLLAESMTRLDAWAAGTDVIEASTVDGLSAWYHRRLHLWRWLHERLAWLAILDLLLAGGEIASIDIDGDEPVLAEMARVVAAARNIKVEIVPTAAGLGSMGSQWAPGAAADRRPAARLRRLPDRVRSAIRRARVDRRLRRLAAEPSRLLVLASPGDRQVITTRDGPSERNAFLDPVIDALTGSALEPIVLELGGSTDGADWARLIAPAGARTIPGELLATRFSRPGDLETRAKVEAAVERVGAISAPMLVGQVDLGPLVKAELVRGIRGALAGRLRDLPRMRRLLRRLHPVGILLVNEYGRPEWLAAARAERIPSAAVQHGIIHRDHVGYRFPDRPNQLILPNRTYVFGDDEARLLTGASVYRPDEVVVAGSPRLDLVPGPALQERVEGRDAVRRELGVADGDRLVVVSTTAAAVLTRFGVIPALGRLFDHPLPNVHLVVKLHPAEMDGSRYERLIGGIAAARGRPAPPLTIVKAIDLYRLLAAADAHLGSYSTVLTEATVIGTPNLLAAADAGGDLLGYAAAGVARPVNDGADLLRELDAAVAVGGAETTAAARAAFVGAHFRPGPAAQRIAADLRAWLVGPDGRPGVASPVGDGHGNELVGEDLIPR
ncbi:MAG TPA: hypothetical protein VFY18_00340 [Candidatus Limnocylindrales bacterium]|nr:hypothetical protein [Candidatus Limnocylindrales bacterium]